MNRFFCSNTTQAIDLNRRLASFVSSAPFTPLTARHQAIGGITTAGSSAQSYVYVIGHINAHFPNLSIEKEFQQAALLADQPITGLSTVSDEVALAQVNQLPDLDSQLYTLLSQPQYNYIARQMSWTLNNADNNQIYTLLPTSNQRLQQFIAAIAPQSDQQPQQVILVGSVLPDQGGTLPKVLVSNTTPANTSTLINVVANGQLTSQTQLNDLTALTLEILSLSANDGETDSDRALNYALYQHPLIYKMSYELGYSVSSTSPNPSGYQLLNVRVLLQNSGNRSVASIIFDYGGINTGARQSWYCTVDVTGEYPFLLTPWARYLSRT